VRISVNLTNYSWLSGPSALPAELAKVARQADEGGIATIWVSDHLIQADPTAKPDQTEMLEAYTTLGFLAANTRRARIGAMVSAVFFRAPALLVKAVTTLDVLTGGRAWLGIGAGYHGQEAEAIGLPLPPAADRFEQLEEALQIAIRMWSGDDSPFEGKHYRLRRPVGSPLPAHRPHPPILIGGAGEKKTLRPVAQYADACNLFDIPDGGETIKRKLDVLARHSDAVGRPYDEIEKTVSTRLNPGEPAAEFAERCAALASLGIEHAVVITAGPWTEEAVTRLAAARGSR
jgi:F420-dependent oxidoreductase-like protein